MNRTRRLIPQIANLYPFDAKTLELINSDIYSPNDTYSFAKNGKEFILRVATHDEDHNSLTAAEMEWLAFLHGRGIPVSLPLPTENGKFVETIEARNKFHAVCAFEKVEGEHCEKENPRLWNDEIIEDYGFTMGKMHAETKNFIPSDEKIKRPSFDASEAFCDSIKELPEILALAESLTKQLLSLPRNAETFGLIHNDFHLNNFFVKGNKVRVFDFDDSLYGYFALDIGIALHHAITWNPRIEAEKAQAEAEKLIRIFMKGYNKANALGEQALRSIPSFMKYRQLCNFGWCYPHNVSPDERDNLLNGLTMQGCRITEDIFIN